MNSEINFLDELLLEVEAKEHKQTVAYFDLVVMEISNLEKEISNILMQAEEESKIINDWALNRSSSIQDKINFLRLKLESFTREEGKKTIDLPHGVLKIRKQPDKVEIIDMDIFLEQAKGEMLTVIPESVKPNLNNIRAYIKSSGRVPAGVNIIEGKEEFKLKIKTKEKDHDSES